MAIKANMWENVAGVVSKIIAGPETKAGFKKAMKEVGEATSVKTRGKMQYLNNRIAKMQAGEQFSEKTMQRMNSVAEEVMELHGKPIESMKKGIKDRYTAKDGAVKWGNVAKDTAKYAVMGTAVGDVAQGIRGERTLFSENGRTNIPIIPGL